jgi:hypothetical protein
MKLNNYLTEAQIFNNVKENEKEKHNINILFDYAIKNCFSEAYQNKIEDFFQSSKINIKEIQKADFLMKTIGNTIFVNMNEMKKRDAEQNVKYLLHEFIHILQGSKSLLFRNKFPELNQLANELSNIAKNNLTKSVSEFLTARKQVLKSSGPEEFVAYLMNDSMDYSALKDNGISYKEAIIKSGIFNTDNSFWKNRLPK